MSDFSAWYLVLEIAASSVLGPVHQPQLLGPVTEVQCGEARAAVSSLPAVVVARCRKAIGMQMVSDGPAGYAMPLFDGDIIRTGSER